MLDPYFLFDIAERERVLFDDPECRHLLDGAKKYVALKVSWATFQLSSIDELVSSISTWTVKDTIKPLI